jgi:hypothetical protein
MPRGPKGEKRPADAIGNAVMIAKIATGEIHETETLRSSVKFQHFASCKVRRFRGRPRSPAGLSGVSRDEKQAVDQGRLFDSALLQKFCELELVEAAMPGGLPFVPHQQAPGFRIEHKTPRIPIGGAGPRQLL